MEFKVSSCTESQLENFIKANYTQFDISFKKMSEDTHYSHKLYTKSKIYECWDVNELIGVLCVYLNNDKNFAYIPYLCVTARYSNKGIASTLLQSISLLKNIDYIELEVRVKNLLAYNLYMKNGFLEIGRNQEKIQLRKIL